MIPEVEKLTEDLNNSSGEAKELADIMRDTVSGAIMEVKSALELIGIEAFNENQIELKELFQDFAQLIRDNKDNIVAGLSNIAAGIIKMGNALLWTLEQVGKVDRWIGGGLQGTASEENLRRLEARQADLLHRSKVVGPRALKGTQL